MQINKQQQQQKTHKTKTSKRTVKGLLFAANLPCELGDSFQKIGSRAVHRNYRDSKWFVRGCGHRCEDLCMESHPWGTCLAYSVRKRWWKGCNCYLYDRFVSSHEFDPDTKGVTENRRCVEGTETGTRKKQKGKGEGKKGNGKKKPSGSETGIWLWGSGWWTILYIWCDS